MALFRFYQFGKKIVNSIQYVLFPVYRECKRILARLIRHTKNDADLAQAYIDNQEEAYQTDEDPWSNFSGPLYRILHLHYQVAAACLEKKDNFILDMGCGLGVFTQLLHENGKQVIGVDTDHGYYKGSG